MNKRKKQVFTYIALFLLLLTVLFVVPKDGGYIWQPEIINPLVALLILLLVYLTGRITHTTETTTGILCTAAFILLFCPNSATFFNRDETAVMELSSVCIVPFFISQYTRISNKDFKYGYFLMLLMGIFCSYTHDSITIPLCASFLTLAYTQRNRLFRLACWPMVIGFLIGTTLSVVRSAFWDPSSWNSWTTLSSHTADGFQQLWNTKVFLFATLLTIYYMSARKRRRIMWQIFQQQKLLAYCLLYSFCAIPFAPLGMENAISGVCFFCMFWVLLLFHNLLLRFRKRISKKVSARQ